MVDGAGKTIIAGTWNKLLIGFTFWGEMKWQIELLGSIRGKPFVMAEWAESAINAWPAPPQQGGE